ncbi:hypothetical protein L1987_35324 [Smallanthus sonchifolius]|uniref:Uncharacterized protein n=1 Tax=Smallanthus sonchifolius TaxID=185202 RepID=A0ACB9HW17_9ASTR|nr:hypothetical protein L1987_35324 [Smallanthus sonchifolius]
MTCMNEDSWRTTLLLAYQSLGVVYGDLSISPLYVYKSTFAEDIHHSETNEEIFGVLSFVFWTLTLVPLFKYVFIVLRADDNGEGGTFALYSSICRHAKVSLLPNRQIADESLSTYKLDQSPDRKYDSKMRMLLEKYKFLRTALLILVLLGTCMVIGDGILTPAISVFSAVSGLELSMSKDHHQLIPITCFILVCLFALQHYGTHRVGFFFAPIVLLWLICISALGLYNIVYWNPHVYQALSPYYMLKFFKKTKKQGWMSLGGILLCITGSEAMFADLGHFSYAAIQIAFTFLIYPALILGYMGQAAYLSRNHQNADQISYYVSVPGLAIIAVMLVTTCLTSLVIILCWHKPPVIALFFLFFFGSIELLYFSASLVKFREGAWLPILLALFLVTIMFVWHYTTIKKYEYDLHNKVSLEWLLALGPTLGMCRVPGIGLVFTDLTSGIPANFSRFVTNLPASLQLKGNEHASASDRSSGEHRLAVVGNTEFSRSLGFEVNENMQQESVSLGIQTVESIGDIIEMSKPKERRVWFAIEDPEDPTDVQMRQELEDLMAAQQSGTAFLLGHSHVKAKQGSSVFKRLAVNFGYNFLRRNCRGADVVLKVPPASLLEVGMVYVV